MLKAEADTPFTLSALVSNVSAIALTICGRSTLWKPIFRFSCQIR